MPPEKDKNRNSNTFKIDIDPVFKGVSNTQNNIDQANPGGVYDVLNNQKYTPSQTTTPITPTSTISNNQKSVIRTYKDDLESALQKNHLSSVNIAIAENQKLHSQTKNTQKENLSSGNSSGKKILFFSLFFIIAGIIGISVFYFINTQTSTSKIVQVQQLPSLITYEYKDELNVNTILKDRFTSALSSKLNDILTPENTIYNLFVTNSTNSTKKLITASDFVSLTKFKIPDALARTLLPDFMIGMYSFDRNLPFLILKTSSFANTYSGMLSWETDLETDFQNIFRLPGYGNNGGTLSKLNPITTKKFQDGVILNKDVRILYDDNNNMLLLYSIVDQQTIVITVNDIVFKEIVNRLNQEKTTQR